MARSAVRRLWLIGMMGTGKTSVGRILAEQNEVVFLDTDLLIASVNDTTIPEFWKAKGEAAFRRMETETIVGAARGDSAVVATGGGAVIDVANVDAMRSSGTVVWLQGTPATLAERIGEDPGRPLLLSGLPTEQTLAKVMGQRHELYVAAAHATVTTDGRSIDEVAKEVSNLWPPS